MLENNKMWIWCSIKHTAHQIIKEKNTEKLLKRASFGWEGCHECAVQPGIELSKFLDATERLH